MSLPPQFTMPEVRLTSILCLYGVSLFGGPQEQHPRAHPLRIGIVGTDTSHATAFTQILNDESSPDHVPGGHVVAAYKGGSPDVESSASRVEKFAEELRDKWKVQLYSSIP